MLLTSSNVTTRSVLLTEHFQKLTAFEMYTTRFTASLKHVVPLFMKTPFLAFQKAAIQTAIFPTKGSITELNNGVKSSMVQFWRHIHFSGFGKGSLHSSRVRYLVGQTKLDTVACFFNHQHSLLVKFELIGSKPSKSFSGDVERTAYYMMFLGKLF